MRISGTAGNVGTREAAPAFLLQPAHTIRVSTSLLYTAEYKRRQAPPGVKITCKSFGRDRRYPITNGREGDRQITVIDQA